ncbi:M20/M25/M40 family metallo-hydrolase [Pontibacter silvestris]|uniref:M20/M25/M40 family metallo-hydrolase n=1 Tax=Pontibacter silvestris TaxID=2305183 RepID=A0ABW4X0Q6_9BACT|nr:M20/M25/M40 family metallo-hydrolase [Pontibacter silvestris]MCC9138438.1 M20/M25/M40 family metallo-hydrolase [Pontibacter silvestris]
MLFNNFDFCLYTKAGKHTFLKSFLFTSVLLFGGSASAQKLSPKRMDVLVAKHMVPAVEELKDYVALPNDAVNPDDILKNVTWAENAFGKRGFQTTVLQNTQLPLLLAEKSFPKASKTILFYFHLDGQPVRANEWQQKNPYQMVLRGKGEDGAYQDLNWNALQANINDDWRVFGRSTSDDKGPIIMLLQALDILQSENQNPLFNIKVVLDPAEEKGSPGLEEALEKYKNRFQSDYMIVMDGPMHSSNRPTLTLGCRGSAGFTITTYGPITPQHSGHYGNYAPNPGFRLAKVIASMKDEQGRVLVEDFYDGISFDEEAKSVMAAVPDNKGDINARLVIAEEEKVGSNYQESLQYPSLNIRGMRSAVVGKGGGTIIPEEAVASFDIRLVPETDGQRMVDLVKKHIEKQGFAVLDHEPGTEERMKYAQIVYMQGNAGTPAFRTDINTPISNWLRKALAKNFDKDPVVIRIMGGTVPVVPFVQALNVPTVLVPLVNIDNNQHSPNENLRLGNLRMGMKTCLSILTSPI